MKVDRKIFVQKNCPLTPSKGYWSICNKVWIFYQVWDHSFVFSFLILKYNTPGLLPGIKINSELFALTEPSLANGVANGYLTICTVTKQYRRNNFLQLKKFLHAHWLIFRRHQGDLRRHLLRQRAGRGAALSRGLRLPSESRPTRQGAPDRGPADLDAL